MSCRTSDRAVKRGHADTNALDFGVRAKFRLQNRGFGLYSTLRSEFLKLRRWSLGLRRWT